MSRTTIILVAFVAALTGAIAMFMMTPTNGVFSTSDDQLSESSVRQIVEQMLAERDSLTFGPSENTAPLAVAQVSPDEINPMIENYLMGDPKILQRVSNALQAQLRNEEVEAARVGLATYSDAIYNEPADGVIGNPDGDVTIVEFFDYNCAFCRRSMPDLVQLMAEDSNLRIVLKEFPILSENSVDAARIAVAVANTEGADYWSFHEELFTVRGQIGKEAALTAAENIGLSRVSIELASQSREIAQTLQGANALAQILNITGTPAFIIGDQIFPGAIGYDALREAVNNVRECGSAVCDS